jgi:hypothetical protein
MNRGAGSLEFAHARIWARWGARPDEALWRRIETTRDLAAMFDLARNSALARWIDGIGVRSDLHLVDRTMRQRFRDSVAELCDWMPPDWQPAIAWCATLVDLPLVQHLARGGAPPAGAADDPVWRELFDAGAAAGPRRHLLDAARRDPQTLLPLWLAQWRALLPPGSDRAAVEQGLLPLVERHLSAFTGPQAVDGWALRRNLVERLVLLMRRAVVEPVAAFAYLALTALELERLRAEIVTRLALPRRSVAP